MVEIGVDGQSQAAQRQFSHPLSCIEQQPSFSTIRHDYASFVEEYGSNRMCWIPTR